MGKLELDFLSRQEIIYQLLRCNKTVHVKSILASEVVDTAVISVRSHTAVPARKCKESRVMSKEIESKIGSTMYNRINAVQMPQVERQRALHALYEADLFVEAFLRAAKKIEQLVERLFLKPALKH